MKLFFSFFSLERGYMNLSSFLFFFSKFQPRPKQIQTDKECLDDM